MDAAPENTADTSEGPGTHDERPCGVSPREACPIEPDSGSGGASNAAGPIPPLEATEGWVLALNLLITQAFFLLLGVAGAIIACGVSTGAWIEAILGGWVRLIGNSLTALPWQQAVAAGVGFAAACSVFAVISEKRALRSEEGRASVYASRQGINGELPRLPLAGVVLLMGIVGFCEELLFRLAIINVTCALLTRALSPLVSIAIALFISTVVFWFAHARYRDLATMALTLVLGLAFGILFVVTGSLAACALAHALYDLAVLLIMRVQMKRDPDYFGGAVPTRILLDIDVDEEPAS